jgi:hypothetical protein
MYLPTMALMLFAASTGAVASPPNPSYTHLQINNAPTSPMRSRVTTHLRRQDARSDDAAYHALQRRARVMRDLPSETMATMNEARGVKSTVSTAREGEEGVMKVSRGERTVRTRQQPETSEARKRRQRRRKAQAQRQRMPKFVAKLA